MKATKTCKACESLLPTVDFYVHKQTKDGLSSECRRCSIARSMRSHYKRKFGLSPEALDEMVKSQNGRCAICGLSPKRVLHVDHDHSTGMVRGLLCGPCNNGLGLFRDDLNLLIKAMKYLG